ncbi:MAG TPA: hypothetical protein VII56_22970 [Rhizomicrobium sp.]
MAIPDAPLPILSRYSTVAEEREWRFRFVAAQPAINCCVLFRIVPLRALEKHSTMLARDHDLEPAAAVRRGFSLEMFGLFCTQAVLLGLVYFIVAGAI